MASFSIDGVRARRRIDDSSPGFRRQTARHRAAAGLIAALGCMHARRLLYHRAGRKRPRQRLPPAPPDRHQGGRAHGRTVHRQQARRADADQRADVLAFASTWRREATGGILIELPAGDEKRNRRGARRARGPLDSFRRCGVPPNAVEVRPYVPADPSKIATVRLNYPTHDGRGRTVRTLAARPRPDRRSRAHRERPYWNLGCAHAAQPRRHGRQPGRPGAAARRDAALHRTPHHRSRQVPPGESTATIYPDAEQGKISDVGK